MSQGMAKSQVTMVAWFPLNHPSKCWLRSTSRPNLGAIICPPKNLGPWTASVSHITYDFCPKFTCPKSTTKWTCVFAHFNEHLSLLTHWARGDRHPLILRTRKKRAELWTLQHGNGQEDWWSASQCTSSWTQKPPTASGRHLVPINSHKTIILSINYTHMLPELLLKSFLITL